MNKNNFSKKYNLILNKIILVFLFIFVVGLVPCFSSIVYHDISTITIRTNFPDEYFDIGTYEEGWYPDEIDYASGEESTDTSKQIYLPSDTKYYIDSCEWYSYDPKDFNIGGKPRIVVYLETQEYNANSSRYDREDYYRFKSSYSSSTCFISKGNLVQATRLSVSTLKVVFELNGIKGTYNEPSDAYWQNNQGLAYWEAPSTKDSGYYDVALYRGGALVHRIDTYRGHTYNFASHMRKEGDYTFKVRTVPSSNSQGYGKASEYVESNSLYIDGTNIDPDPYDPGGGGSDTRVGWVKINNIWYYYRPDGQMVTNGWVKWQDHWYYLNNYGAMQTGAITVDGYNYYLGSDGAMVAGWLQSGGSYYFYDTTSGSHYGAMCINTWVYYDNKYFYFDENGVMVTGWKQIGDGTGKTAFYYFYPAGSTSGLYGYMATNTTINGFNIGADGKWIQN